MFTCPSALMSIGSEATGEPLREFELVLGTEDCRRVTARGDYAFISDRLHLSMDMLAEDGGIGDPVPGMRESPVDE